MGTIILCVVSQPVHLAHFLLLCELCCIAVSLLCFLPALLYDLFDCVTHVSVSLSLAARHEALVLRICLGIIR